MFSYRSIAVFGLLASASLSVLLAADDSQRLQIGRVTFVFATQAEGRAVLTTPDRFTREMSPFDRKTRMRTSEDRGEQAFLDFAGSAARPWTDSDREAITRAIKTLEPALQTIKPLSIDEVLLVHTSGTEESGAAYTRGSAIVLPAGQTGRLEKPRSKLIAHELFHVLSRNNPEIRDQLYQRIGFRRSGPIALPGMLADRKITNPDAPETQHVIDLKIDQDRTITVAPVLYAKREFDPRGSVSLLRYLEFRLMEVVPIVGKRYVARLVDGKPRLHEASFPDFHRQIGRNTSYIIHPEEILADNFASFATGDRKVPDKWLIDAIGELMFDAPQPSK